MKTASSGKQKYLILLLLFLGWTLGNLDRFAISYAVLGISTDLSLKASQTGMLLSSFFLGYTLMQTPGGYLADRFGYRKVILIAILAWSIFTLLTGAAWSLISMIVIRILFGIGEGGYIPSASKAIAHWFSQNQRSRAMAVLLASGSIIGIITPLLAVFLMKAFGWRAMFALFGVCGLIVLSLMFFFLKEKRAETSARPAEERTSTQSKVPWNVMLKNPLIWSLFIASFSIYAVLWGMNSWMPTYLAKARGLDLTSVGSVSAIGALVGIIGVFLSGYVLDKLPISTGRKVVGVFALVSGMLLYLMGTAPTILLYVVYSCLLSLFLPFITTLVATAALKTLPAELAGSATGLINTGGQAAGILTPLVIGFLIDAFGGSYTPAFVLLVACSVLCAVALLVARVSQTTEVSIELPTEIRAETIGTEL